MACYLPDTINCKGESFKVFITKAQIDQRVAELGELISAEYAGKQPILIGILNGSFIFLADIMRQISIPCEVDFYKLSSYGDQMVSSGRVTERKDLDAKIQGRHVIIIEDIIDTGLSIDFLLNRIREQRPASICVITLLHKSDATIYDVQIDHVGFQIPSLFVLGYGLDYGQEGRNLAQIYVIDRPSD